MFQVLLHPLRSLDRLHGPEFFRAWQERIGPVDQLSRFCSMERAPLSPLTSMNRAGTPDNRYLETRSQTCQKVCSADGEVSAGAWR